MKISVVMTTYNGERFINEQLESILNQTRLPNEVLIFDDQSTDKTQEIITEFIKNNNLESFWHFEVNVINKGCVRNFLDGAKRALGDIIFYADQDDIWAKNKIELMEKGFSLHPEMMACYCLRHFIDVEGKEINLKFQNMTNVRVYTKGFQKVSLEEAIRFNKSPGLCLAVRKQLIDETRDMILENSLTHDLPLGTVAAIYNGYYVLNRKLVYYRQHDKNVSSARYSIKSRLTEIDKQIEGRNVRLKQMKAIYKNYRKKLAQKDRRNLKNAILSTKESIENLRNRNICKLFLSIFNMNPMMNRWIAVNNFLISIRRKV